MNTSSIIIIVAGVIAFILGIIARLSFMHMGRNSERLKNAENTIDAIKKGNIAASDDSHDNELRDKYGLD